MLSLGLIHGDLSEFNVLLASDGPVIIDLPQVVNAAGNNAAFAMLERDTNNIRSALGRFAPELLQPNLRPRCGSSTSRASCVRKASSPEYSVVMPRRLTPPA